MKIKPTRSQGVLLLAVAGLIAAGSTMAQTKTATPAVKKMTREELRACMKMKDDAVSLNTGVETQRKALDAQKAEFAREADALKTLKVEVDRRTADVKALQPTYAAHQVAINDWNQRMETLVKERPRNYERQRNKLDDELRDLKKRQAELDAERDRLMNGYEALISDYNQRANANAAQVRDWNARNEAAAKDADRVFELRADYAADCANRPFNEADEIAIKKGK